GQAVTDSLVLSWPAEKGFYEASPEAGIVKMAVWNRYQEESVPQIGFLKGLGLKRGALAQTVSHDSHQLVCAGTDDGDILLAARTAASLGGGLALVLDGRVLGTLALPLGGLMTHEPVEKIASVLDSLLAAGRSLGLEGEMDPFLVLGFMSLPVIPRLKLTSAGLIEDFKLVPLVFD
ncbi:MAG: adenine deaminase, partial [Deltaproteobacteria bacterium]|nr:adenine deaminase [Deltaproteobacteria bacterium]